MTRLTQLHLAGGAFMLMLLHDREIESAGILQFEVMLDMDEDSIMAKCVARTADCVCD